MIVGMLLILFFLMCRTLFVLRLLLERNKPYKPTNLNTQCVMIRHNHGDSVPMNLVIYHSLDTESVDKITNEKNRPALTAPFIMFYTCDPLWQYSSCELKHGNLLQLHAKW